MKLLFTLAIVLGAIFMLGAPQPAKATPIQDVNPAYHQGYLIHSYWHWRHHWHPMYRPYYWRFHHYWYPNDGYPY